MDQFLNLALTTRLLQGDLPMWGWVIVTLFWLSSRLWDSVRPQMVSWFQTWKQYYLPQMETEYLLQGKIIHNINFFDHCVIFPTEYRAVMFKIHQLGIDIQKAKRVGIYSSRVAEKNQSLDQIFMHMINTTTHLELTPQIRVSQENISQTADDQKSTIETYNLYLQSNQLTFHQLKSQVDQWTQEYEKYLKEYNDGKLYVFSYLGKTQKGKEETRELEFEQTLFESSRRFENIFFEQKEKVLTRLQRFTQEEDHYRHKGIPYTLGFLFYGPPGCGKTSTIKAMANFFDRHVIEIHLSRVKTCRELKEIFCRELINDLYVPTNRKIIVLEDIDCMGEIVHQREEDSPTSPAYLPEVHPKPSLHLRSHLGPSAEMERYEHPEKSDQLTLSYILNLIDGLNEQHGRIIVMTTNHPEKLDEALVRPGRIDLKIHFQRCSPPIIQEMIEFYFERSIPEEWLREHSFPDQQYTPAEVFQRCQNLEDLMGTCQSLAYVG